MRGKRYDRPAKTANVIYKCKRCKLAVRQTFTVESYSYDNEHPTHYLRKTWSYRRLAGAPAWTESHYFRFPAAKCPGCQVDLTGKPVEGVFNADHPCDSRCTGAKGHSCECACGGANHGADHAAPV